MKRKWTKKRGFFARRRIRQHRAWFKGVAQRVSPFGMAVRRGEAPPPRNHRKRLFKFEPGWRQRLRWALNPELKPIDTGKLKRSWGTVETAGDDRLRYRVFIPEENAELREEMRHFRAAPQTLERPDHEFISDSYLDQLMATYPPDGGWYQRIIEGRWAAEPAESGACEPVRTDAPGPKSQDAAERSTPHAESEPYWDRGDLDAMDAEAFPDGWP